MRGRKIIWLNLSHTAIIKSQDKNKTKKQTKTVFCLPNVSLFFGGGLYNIFFAYIETGIGYLRELIYEDLRRINDF